jgi:hypothetical protein
MEHRFLVLALVFLAIAVLIKRCSKEIAGDSDGSSPAGSG